jgi:hypothetical protein
MTPRASAEWPVWGMAWGLSALVILGFHPDWLTDQVRLVPAAAPAVLSPAHVWQVPLAGLPGAELFATWWLVLFAGVAAGLIAFVSHGRTRELSCDRLLATLGLSLLVQPTDLCCALVLGLLAAIRNAPRFAQRPLSAAWLAVGCGVLGVLTTLEFGLVLGFAAYGLGERLSIASPARSELRGTLVPCLTFVIGIALASLLLPGFGHAALRPLSWWWIRPPLSLLPSLSPAVASWSQFLPLALLVPFAGWCWQQALLPTGDRRPLAPFVICTLIGLGCSRYSFLAGLALVSLFVGQATAAWMFRRPFAVGVTCLLIAGVHAAYRTDWSPLVTGQTVSRRLQPTAWDTAGPVLLLNLDHSSDWWADETVEKFPLMVDDRWDVLGDEYPAYEALCRDLRQVRDHGYLRTDGQWGGYKRWIDERSPTLLVVDTTDTDSIRGLSLSPDWRFMGIDGARTMFGRADEARNLPQLRHALRCLMTLEWPARLTDFTLENTIVSGDGADDRTVAGALCALRFPYAALRFVRDDRSSESQRLQAWCLLELAHRVAGHSSTGSLLDQHRAVVQAGKVWQSARWRPEDRNRIARSLQGLGLSTPADKFEVRPTDGADSHELQDSTLDQTERDLRRALLSGRTEEAQRLLGQIAEPLRAYYRVLVDAPQRSAGELCVDFPAAITAMGDRAPSERKSEAQFYLGCAAIEAGESLLAISAFEESAKLAPNLPFREIRGVYLRQLTR